MGGDADFIGSYVVPAFISIHTSVWEVTIEDDELIKMFEISIHTSVWEVTAHI